MILASYCWPWFCIWEISEDFKTPSSSKIVWFSIELNPSEIQYLFNETLFCITILVLLLLLLFNSLEATHINSNSKVEMKLRAEIMIKLPSNEHLVYVWCHAKCFKHLLFTPQDNILIGLVPLLYKWRTRGILEWLGDLPKLALLS